MHRYAIEFVVCWHFSWLVAVSPRVNFKRRFNCNFFICSSSTDTSISWALLEQRERAGRVIFLYLYVAILANLCIRIELRIRYVLVFVSAWRIVWKVIFISSFSRISSTTNNRMIIELILSMRIDWLIFYLLVVVFAHREYLHFTGIFFSPLKTVPRWYLDYYERMERRYLYLFLSGVAIALCKCFV